MKTRDPVLCIECGLQHETQFAGPDPFAIPCPRCKARNSIPVDYETSLIEDGEDWSDEEAAVIF